MKRKVIFGVGASLACVVFAALPVSAQSSAAADAVQAVVDNLWVFIAAVLVFFMQAGFALVESGMTRAKNVINIMAKNLADASVGILAFLAVGYALAFGGSGAFWGTEGFFLSGSALFEAGSSGVGNLSSATFFLFQAVFAATAATIVSGAMAERTRFSTYLIVSLVMTALVYPTVVHWTWGGGFIADLEIFGARYSDFAGSTVVHSTGAFAALMGAYFLGPRLGWSSRKGIPGHSIPQVVLGVFILWLGWFGFNAGSALAANGVVMLVGMNTAIAAASSTLAAGGMTWVRTGKPSLTTSANGALAGLVSITAGCATMNVLGALVTGAVAGVLLTASERFVARRGIDDPVGAISVHGACGIWGTLAVGLFARYDDAFLGRENAGLFYGGGGGQLLVQLIFILIVMVWTLATMGALFFLLRKLDLLRVSPKVETEGLDLLEHGVSAYGEDPFPGRARATGRIE